MALVLGCFAVKSFRNAGFQTHTAAVQHGALRCQHRGTCATSFRPVGPLQSLKQWLYQWHHMYMTFACDGACMAAWCVRISGKLDLNEAQHHYLGKPEHKLAVVFASSKSTMQYQPA
eukprot:4148331-Pleurochrysis_carterae.AAC.2